MAKVSNPNHSANLKPWKPGQSGNPAGRPPKVKNLWKTIPKDAQKRLYGVLYHAIELGSVDEAKAYLQQVNEAEPGQYGIVLEVTINALSGNFGWQELCDIYDRLFGKPRQQSDVNVGGEVNFTFKFGGEQ